MTSHSDTATRHPAYAIAEEIHARKAALNDALRRGSEAGLFIEIGINRAGFDQSPANKASIAITITRRERL